MSIMTYNQFITEEKGIKDIALGALLGLTPLQSTGQQQPNPKPITQQQQKQILSIVKGPIIKVPIQTPLNQTDFDMVHAFSGRLNDDFETRVSNELKRLNQMGELTDVTDIQITTYQQGNSIITESKCNIIRSTNGISYNHFTTRGSIGHNFAKRHDEQFLKDKSGLTLLERLENLYGGEAKIISTDTITFKVNSYEISYKQSFIVASEKKSLKPQTIQSTIKGTSLSDLRQNLKSQTKNQSIDLTSVVLNLKDLTVTFSQGNQPVENLSIIWSNNSQDDLDQRISQQKETVNPTIQVLTKKTITDKTGETFFLALLAFPK